MAIVGLYDLDVGGREIIVQPRQLARRLLLCRRAPDSTN